MCNDAYRCCIITKAYFCVHLMTSRCITYVPSEMRQHIQLVLLNQRERPRPNPLQLAAQDPTVSRAPEHYDQWSVTGGLHDELLQALNTPTTLHFFRYRSSMAHNAAINPQQWFHSRALSFCMSPWRVVKLHVVSSDLNYEYNIVWVCIQSIKRRYFEHRQCDWLDSINVLPFDFELRYFRLQLLSQTCFMWLINVHWIVNKFSSCYATWTRNKALFLYPDWSFPGTNMVLYSCIHYVVPLHSTRSGHAMGWVTRWQFDGRWLITNTYENKCVVHISASDAFSNHLSRTGLDVYKKVG